MTLDEIDVRILECLQENARMSSSSIGERVNMSVSAVIERIKKLENSGIIKKYTVNLDNNKLGKDVLAFVEISTEHHQYNEVIRNIQEFASTHPDVLECHVVTGNSDLIMKVVADNTKSLEQILNALKEVNGVSYTRTAIVMSSLKDEISLTI